MANLCINGISFHGKDLTKIKSMIAEAIEVNKTHVGWLPESVDVSKLSYAHYLFDIEINGETEDSISFACWTKWSPPIEELEYICRDAKVSCTCWYEESGMGLYGQSEYCFETDKTTDVRLEDKDMDRVTYDEENDVYLLDGKSTIESDSVAYQDMLDEKLNTLHPTDWVIYDKANDNPLQDSYGRVLIFGDKREADDDCRGNESVIRCTDLPVHWQETILKQLNNL